MRPAITGDAKALAMRKVHIGEDCEAGYKRLVPPDESCGCCGQGCEHWHIEPKETQEETP